MADKMDRGLDEIIADNRSNGSRNRRGGGQRRDRDRQSDYPRDGVRKSFRDEPRSIDNEWVHDRYEENNSRRGPAPRRRREHADDEVQGSKLRVENIHYELTEEDLEELFERIGKVAKLQLRYDRAGRSEGTAFVTYDRKEDATEAIRQFDGANANGQPIRLSLMSSGPSRNPFDSAVMPGKPLSERVSAPGGRSRSYSPSRRNRGGDDHADRRDVDRYVPGGGSRSRSPMPRRRGGDRGGRRPGARRDGGGRDQDGGRSNGRDARGNPRGKKTQEELDAEMADYFGGGGGGAGASGAGAEASVNAGPTAPTNAAAAPAALGDDIDMIE